MAVRRSHSRWLALVVLAWMIGTTGARDLLHNHSGFAERPDCPACRLDRTAGVTTSVTMAVVAIPVLVPLGVVPDLYAAGSVSGQDALEPPPRSPPLPL
ncbi:MAG: hypothetical protein MUE61_09925 [Vicinamibacterales bacterium]|jgi:hypothetical protein|nr:hypothetical protein [Vicinamibacterales bacterium]